MYLTFSTELQLKRQERKRRSNCISPQNALEIDPEVYIIDKHSCVLILFNLHVLVIIYRSKYLH